MKITAYALCVCSLCLLLFGCKSAGQPQPPETSAPATQVTQPTTAQTEPAPAVTEAAPAVTEVAPVFEESGKLRVPYTVNHSGVRYVTSPSQLPKDEVFDQYGEAFFRNHALLLVTETVASGSVDISIASIHTDGSKGIVVLEHSLAGDAGTADMATWLVWTVVDAGLDLQWSVENPALPNSSDIQTS